MSWYNCYFTIKYKEIIRETPKAYLLKPWSELSLPAWIPKMACRNVKKRHMEVKGWFFVKNPGLEYWVCDLSLCTAKSRRYSRSNRGDVEGFGMDIDEQIWGSGGDADN